MKPLLAITVGVALIGWGSNNVSSAVKAQKESLHQAQSHAFNQAIGGQTGSTISINAYGKFTSTKDGDAIPSGNVAVQHMDKHGTITVNQ